MNGHRGDQARIVHLNANDGVNDHEATPLGVYLIVIHKQGECTLDQLSATICLGYRQSKSILMCGPSADVPELGDVLGSEA